VSTKMDVDGWDLRESGPKDADHTILLLPGGMCTATFFDDLMAEPKLVEAPIRLVAATLPGFGGTSYPEDLSVENYARLAGKLASDLGCDVVAGHSLGGNVALEMAALGEFSGPVVLLSPSFSREDEMKELGMLDRVGRVPGLGALIWRVMLKLMPSAMKSKFPPARREALVAEMKNNDPRVCRRMVRRYFEYLDRHGSLVSRLCGSGVKAWVVFGDRDEVGLTDEERRGLEACPTVTLLTTPDASHMIFTDQPGWTADLILDVVSGNPTRR
jgi:pimeloyl-ACP methyl ester carboxylesterase